MNKIKKIHVLHVDVPVEQIKEKGHLVSVLLIQVNPKVKETLATLMNFSIEDIDVP
ncbi:hypothetical protein [Halalkalibacter lacteus]|uniref:hypothetical protein n=1 Tax=Halalkalibacter lacteus TaxID=3090663 RepID=UPI002FC6DB0E